MPARRLGRPGDPRLGRRASGTHLCMWVVAVMPFVLLALPIGLQVMESRLLDGPARTGPVRTGPADAPAPSSEPSIPPTRSVERESPARPVERRPRTLAV